MPKCPALRKPAEFVELQFCSKNDIENKIVKIPNVLKVFICVSFFRLFSQRSFFLGQNEIPNVRYFYN